MNCYDWISNMQPHHLCLQDVSQWDIGHKQDFLLLDQNFEEYYIWPNLEKGHLYQPKDFFLQNKVEAEYVGDFTWKLKGPVEVEDKLWICTKSWATTTTWKALDTDNSVTIRSDILPDRFSLPKREAVTVPFSQLSPLTRVGWRGPCIPWNVVEESTQEVYWC